MSEANEILAPCDIAAVVVTKQCKQENEKISLAR
jgi:hypothetical protein